MAILDLRISTQDPGVVEPLLYYPHPWVKKQHVCYESWCAVTVSDSELVS